MNELHCPEVSSFRDVDGTEHVAFGSKADWIFAIYLLPATCSKLNINVIVSNLCGWGVLLVRSSVSKPLHHP